MQLARVWHIRNLGLSTAFETPPSNIIQHAVMRYRGWEPFNHLWWRKCGRRSTKE